MIGGDSVPRGVNILERALNLAPDDILIMEDLGMAFIADGKITEGEELLKRAGKEQFRIDELKLMMQHPQ